MTRMLRSPSIVLPLGLLTPTVLKPITLEFSMMPQAAAAALASLPTPWSTLPMDFSMLPQSEY
uniref:Uncharacterized protein n=1 Tax=Oryza nivara TaxID=4536 RepID=A0A0E0JA36_ORYNI